VSLLGLKEILGDIRNQLVDGDVPSLSPSVLVSLYLVSLGLDLGFWLGTSLLVMLPKME
jgi:hypothetical protein